MGIDGSIGDDERDELELQGLGPFSDEGISDEDGLLLKRIQQAKRDGRRDREQMLEQIRELKVGQQRAAEREQAERKRRAMAISDKIPARIRNAEKWKKKTTSVMQLQDSDFARVMPPPKEPWLTGVAQLVFEQCERLGLRPRVVDVSDACMENPDAGSHKEIHIFWD